jgi:flagellar hook-associated protein 1
MPGSFQGLYSASSALRSFQRAMEVTGNNLSNVNTRGYSRRTTEFAQSEPIGFWSQGQKFVGTGVNIQSITRARAGFLDLRMQTALGDQAKYSATAGGLRSIEALYNEPGENGINNALGKFFDSWSSLASNPSDSVARVRVKDSANLLATRVRDTWSGLNQLKDSVNVELQGNIQRIDTISSQIASLNSQIRQNAGLGGEPSHLLDQRDMLVDELSGIVNVSTSVSSDGTMSVFMSNYSLVDTVGSHSANGTVNAATGTMTIGTQSIPIRGGALAGQIATLNRIQSAQSELDTFANQLKTQINAIHRTGTNSAGATNVDFFNDVVQPAPPATPIPQSGAIDFSVNAALLSDPSQIATGTTGNAGDGSLALQLSRLRDQKFGTLGNKTFGEFYGQHIGKIAEEIRYHDAQAETFESIVAQVESQRQSISGVNLDEEMVDMQRYQRSYQAAARVLSVMDQMTEDLINIIR